MAKLTNGRVTMEVPDEKAQHYANMTGYKIVSEDPKQPEPEVPEPRKPRGRPRKAS